MKTFSLLHPRDQIVSIMERIYGHEMTTTSGGNISVRDENGDVWITPARVDKGSLRRQDIVRISPNGEKEGLHPPSSESPFHLSVYEVRPDLHAVIHAHPGALVSFSICGQVPDTHLFPEAWHVCGKVAFAPYALPGSIKLGARIAEQCGSKARPNCVVLENHGVVVGGDTLAKAFERFETLEFTAQIILNARLLGPVNYLSEAQIELSKKPRSLSPESSSKAPSSREKELRKEICDFIHRAYEHRLVTSTWGSFSARVDEDSFVVTPSHVDRRDMGLEDLVVVRDGSHTPGPEAEPCCGPTPGDLPCPSRNSGDRQRIAAKWYRVLRQRVSPRHPHNPGKLPVSKRRPKNPFEHQFGDGEEVAAVVGPKNPVALLENNGVLVAGRTVLDAFDRLEVLEATAAAIIRSRALGSISAMGPEVIQELLRAFPGL